MAFAVVVSMGTGAGVCDLHMPVLRASERVYV